MVVFAFYGMLRPIISRIIVPQFPYFEIGGTWLLRFRSVFLKKRCLRNAAEIKMFRFPKKRKYGTIKPRNEGEMQSTDETYGSDTF